MNVCCFATATMLKECGLSNIVFVNSSDLFHTRAVSFLRYVAHIKCLP